MLQDDILELRHQQVHENPELAAIEEDDGLNGHPAQQALVSNRSVR
jgi:hypothetical protein